MQLLRTKFKGEILSEFLPPIIDGQFAPNSSHKIIILTKGFPGYPGKATEAAEFLSQRGFWVFTPRYRGTWESDGIFLEQAPHYDILDLISELKSGFIELWSGQKMSIPEPEIYIFGTSFGGAVALNLALHEEIKKVVALSPVVDWQVESQTDGFKKEFDYANLAFANCYRLGSAGHQKLIEEKDFSPSTKITEFQNRKIGDKILIFHCKDDAIVPFQPTKDFAQNIGCELVELNEGGHLSSSQIVDEFFWTKIKSFLKKD